MAKIWHYSCQISNNQKNEQVTKKGQILYYIYIFFERNFVLYFE